MKPERMLCLWCPDWPVVAARRADPALAGVPVVVLDRGFVLAASAEARAEGVRRGLRRREAEVRCPGLVLRPVDTAGEARAFEALVRVVEALAPRLALDRPGLLFVPTRGPSRYFGGDEAFAARILAETARVLGEPPGAGDPAGGARVGVADGAFAAALSARRAAPGAAFVVPRRETAAFLAPWPVRVLDDDELAGLLVRLGLPTLGDFTRLPEASVLGRFGVTGLAAHRRARGEEEHPPASRLPPPEMELHHEFDPPVSRVDTAVFAGRALAERLLEELAADGLVCTRVRVEAETEHGERLARCWRLSAGSGAGGAGSSPGAAILAERVRGQLEAWVGRDEGPGRADRGRSADDDLVTSGLTLLRLVPEEVVVAGRSQLGLWGGDRAAAERAGRALVRVQFLLEPEAVTTPVLQGGRTPDERIAWVPWGEDPPPPPAQSRPPAAPDRLDSCRGLCPTTVQTSPASGAAGGNGIAAGGAAGGNGIAAAAWPGAIPPPAPAIVFRPPRPAELLDASGRRVTVSGRGEASSAPERLTSPALPGGGGPVEAWAGPWLSDLRWWDQPARRRRALWQMVAAGVACLVSVEGGEAHLEAVYD
ncbi:MAG TPA: DNA polymerase Y family protein [Acidimicrobiia bacterium]|nr:DNA polymerase Y family protein [Acidimicrobiia bacterium]